MLKIWQFTTLLRLENHTKHNSWEKYKSSVPSVMLETSSYKSRVPSVMLGTSISTYIWPST